MNRLLSIASTIGLVAFAASAHAITISGPSTIVQGLPDQYFVTLLIVSGILLMLAELKISSYGVLGIGGVACMLGACAILVHTGQSLFGIPPAMIIPVLVAITVIEVMLVIISLRSTKGDPTTGTASYVGQIAEVSRPLSPDGKVFFNGTYWDATSASPVAAGSKVRIVAAERMRLTVAPLD
jgi:membrane-bound serine protease (ClpP class)